MVTFDYEPGTAAMNHGYMLLNDFQAQAILDMRLARLTGLERDKLGKEATELRDTIKRLTAILASVVIGLFDATIEEIVALAVLMPIVASMGGNAGTQTLTVAVRAIAMKEITATNASRLIGKELMVGVLNGIGWAIIVSMFTFMWFEEWVIGGIIGAAMIINLFVAALAGFSIPLILKRMNIDPALGGGVVLTTVTDVIGYSAFLGLGAAFLL